MGRTLAALFGLALTLLSARDARAIPITPADFPGGTLVQEHQDAIGSSTFRRIGEIDSVVLRDSLGRYVYQHTVTPWLTNNTIFDTQFTVHGFAGLAGWFFQEALEAGGTGTDADFQITYKAPGEPLGPGEIPGQLRWAAQAALDWDGRDPITFFFVSNLPPAAPGALRKNYRLVGEEVGTAQVPAPVPEPASIVLFGSALLALHSARRRRRCRV
jgi:hypothetical protein